jgi:hypothetical protein
VEVIQVRLEGLNEPAVRKMAKQMGMQISRVKHRGDCVQLYGTIILTHHQPQHQENEHA